jgi:flagellar basal body-associated protein FliL
MCRDDRGFGDDAATAEVIILSPNVTCIFDSDLVAMNCTVRYAGNRKPRAVSELENEDHLPVSCRISEIGMESINEHGITGNVDEKQERKSVLYCSLSPRTVDSSTKTRLNGDSDVEYLITCIRDGNNCTFSINITMANEQTSRSQTPRHVADHRTYDDRDVIEGRTEQVPSCDTAAHKRRISLISTISVVCVVVVAAAVAVTVTALTKRPNRCRPSAKAVNAQYVQRKYAGDESLTLNEHSVKSMRNTYVDRPIIDA